jgi:hypothetical protein
MPDFYISIDKPPCCQQDVCLNQKGSSAVDVFVHEVRRGTMQASVDSFKFLASLHVPPHTVEEDFTSYRAPKQILLDKHMLGLDAASVSLLG